MQEGWKDPLGRDAIVTKLGREYFTTSIPEDAEDIGDYEWYADFPGQKHPEAFRISKADNPRLFVERVVFPLEPWSGWDALHDELVRDGWTPPAPTEEELATCEHGLSLQLCAGPGHYPNEDFAF